MKSLEEERAALRLVCAWCKKILRQGEGPKPRVSHGICEKCSEKFLGDIKKETTGE